MKTVVIISLAIIALIIGIVVATKPTTKTPAPAVVMVDTAAADKAAKDDANKVAADKAAADKAAKDAAKQASVVCQRSWQ